MFDNGGSIDAPRLGKSTVGPSPEGARTCRNVDASKPQSEGNDRMRTEAPTVTNHPAPIQTSPIQTERRSRPVLIWAGIGSLFAAFNIYLYTAWVVSGDFSPVAKGPTPVPTSARWVVHGWEALISTFFLVLLYRWVI